MKNIGIPRWHSSLAFLALILSAGLTEVSGQTATVNSAGTITGASSTPVNLPAILDLTPKVTITNPLNSQQIFVIKTEWEVDGVVRETKNAPVLLEPGETRQFTPRQDANVLLGGTGTHSVQALTGVEWNGSLVVQDGRQGSPIKTITVLDLGEGDGDPIGSN